jgi:hypothetical protein
VLLSVTLDSAMATRESGWVVVTTQK